MQGFLATMLGANASKGRREEPVAATAYCSIIEASATRCGLARR